MCDALDAAVRARGGGVEEVIFHNDRGTQYTSAAFAAVCERHGVRRSMDRVGSSYDNALAEAFFATRKRELLHNGQTRSSRWPWRRGTSRAAWRCRTRR
ncbi:DDE-type integrase/transposase/recombinase [Saccharopolyspora shandongensis]|uniref:DDE-type integrase/transposase/recombinase n=1 Tax=Saccharopolyspora shandongensis TaxID=418495 RepID=UPI0034169767